MKSRYKLQCNRVRLRRAFMQCMVLIYKYFEFTKEVHLRLIINQKFPNAGIYSAARSVLTDKSTGQYFALTQPERVLTERECYKIRSGIKTDGKLVLNINSPGGEVSRLTTFLKRISEK